MTPAAQAAGGDAQASGVILLERLVDALPDPRADRRLGRIPGVAELDSRNFTGLAFSLADLYVVWEMAFRVKLMKEPQVLGIKYLL